MIGDVLLSEVDEGWLAILDFIQYRTTSLIDLCTRLIGIQNRPQAKDEVATRKSADEVRLVTELTESGCQHNAGAISAAVLKLCLTLKWDMPKACTLVAQVVFNTVGGSQLTWQAVQKIHLKHVNLTLSYQSRI